MASEDEERALENQLEEQLHELKDSLTSLDDALSSDPSDSELLSIQEELVQSIKDAENRLLHLKRARLLRQVDEAAARQSSSQIPKDVEVVHIDDTDGEAAAHQSSNQIGDDVEVVHIDDSDGEAEPVEEPDGFAVGSKCRFRFTNGRWYSGKIIEFEGSDVAKISFLTPTSDNMLMCKFFRQQRCRFGTSCRMSHGMLHFTLLFSDKQKTFFNGGIVLGLALASGVDVPLSSLKDYVPAVWDQSLVGSSILAMTDRSVGIWREAELQAWDSELRMGKVVFRDDGSSAKLEPEAMSLCEYGIVSEEEDGDTSSEQSVSSDCEEESPGGLGFLGSANQQRGIQKETAIFAKWENHTRGIASKMMASMGYREGMGLGASGQGMVNPIPVKVLPAKQSLDHALESQRGEESKENHGKKRSRGGKRKREKKFAEAARAAKASAKNEEEARPDVFSFINDQLAMHGKAVNGGGSAKKEQAKGSVEKKVDRRALVAYEDEVKDLKMQVVRLEEMANRNRKEKLVYEATMRRLKVARKALEDAQATHASATNAIVSKEKEKKWLKF
ncbi:Zinc finger CCCH domain-containing protein 18 [Linum perenne]